MIQYRLPEPVRCKKASIGNLPEGFICRGDSVMNLIHFYRTPALSDAENKELYSVVRQKVSKAIENIQSEYCFNVGTKEPLSQKEIEVLKWLLSETFEPGNFSDKSFLSQSKSDKRESLVEVGPRMNFTTAWSTNAVSVCHACGLDKIERIERSRRYSLRAQSELDRKIIGAFLEEIHDRMTECEYPETLTTFESGVEPEPVFSIPLIEDGKAALEKINREMGLGLDDWDVDYYYNLFVNDIGRNPTNVECFDLSQSNSEHSRHWFFTLHWPPFISRTINGDA